MGDQRGQHVRLVAQQHAGGDGIGGQIGRQVEQVQTTGPVQRRGKARLLADNLAGQVSEILAGELRGQRPHDVAFTTQRHAVHDVGAQHVGGAVFDLGELRADLRLKRKAPQQGGTERVDRLNFQPAGRFDGTGKQRARAAQCLGRSGMARAQIDQRLRQFRVGQHRPGPQPLEQPVLHLGRRRLGIGQAQDVLRFDPVQQQPRHPVGQHPRLARPRIGRQPCRRIGPRRLKLAAGGFVQNRHVTSSGVALVPVSHSP